MEEKSASRIRRALIAGALVAAAIGAPFVGGASAQAASARCGDLACTVYLDWNETRALAAGRVPNLNLGAFTPVYRIAAQGHVLVARGWVARGNCVALTLNLRPWASQGMVGWLCR